MGVHEHKCVDVGVVKWVQFEIPLHYSFDSVAAAIVFYRVFRGSAALQKACVVYAVSLLPPAGGVPLVP